MTCGSVWTPAEMGLRNAVILLPIEVGGKLRFTTSTKYVLLRLLVAKNIAERS